MAQTTTQKAPIFEAPDKPLNVSATGIEQLARAGARVGEEGAQAGRYQTQGADELAKGVDTLGKGIEAAGVDIQQHENLTDLTNINANHAQTLLSLTQAQQKFFSNPANANNPQAVQQFQDQFVSPAVDALQASAQTTAGQRHAAELSGVLEDHFVTTSSQTSAAAAAQNTKNQLAGMGQALTSASQINPANIQVALAAYDTARNTYAAQNPNINISKDDPERLTARREIIASGLQSLIDKSVADTGQAPNLDGFFKQYGPELGGQAQEHLQNYADTKVRLYNEQQKSNAATDRQIEADAAKQAATKLTTSIIQLDQSGNPTGVLAVPKDFYNNILKLGNMDGATEAQVKSSVELARSIQKEPPGYQGAHDDTTFNSFMKRAFAAEGEDQLTYKDVNDARAAGHLTNSEFTTFNEAVGRNEKTNANFDKSLINNSFNTVRATLNPNGISDADGAAKVQNFSNWFYPQLHALTAGGMSTADAVTKLVTPQNMDLHGVSFATPSASASAPATGSTAQRAADAVGKFFHGLFPPPPEKPSVPLPPKGQ